MSKRCNNDNDDDNAAIHAPPSKRPRTTGVRGVDRLSSLSDELLLHILSCLPIPSLIVCQGYSIPSEEVIYFLNDMANCFLFY